MEVSSYKIMIFLPKMTFLHINLPHIVDITQLLIKPYFSTSRNVAKSLIRLHTIFWFINQTIGTSAS